MTVRLICDSSQNVPESFQDQLGIVECPASIVFGHEVYLNKVEMSNEEFYQRLAALPSDAALPTTTQPSPGQFRAAIDRVKAEGATGAILTSVSARLSGTYNSTIQAIEDEQDIPVAVWDTASASMGAGWQTIAAAEMGQDGASLEEIMVALPHIQAHTRTAFTVDTLRYLVAGGRLSPIQGMMGSLLNIKPMLIIEDGILMPVQRQRGRQRAKRALIDIICRLSGDHPMRIAIANANVPDEAEALAEEVRAAMDVRELVVIELGPVLAALAGPGLMAIAALRDNR